uniref:Transient receptor potential cation channel, subfamily V, member 6 n=1 Tax=Esox lucius TaxID=8010 RepID=A0AAY5KS89_ESOLU
MATSLTRSAPGELNHWWCQLRFRLQNRKGLDLNLDETFLLQSKLINDIPLFFAAKENSSGCIKKLLDCASTNVFERGALGETALHVAVLYDNMEAAVALMEGAPELINEPMTSDLFHGMTPLHVAVVNQNINLVRNLIARGADVTTPRVTGLYFRKRPGGQLYYGEHILSFAACVGNKDIISLVINAGASTRAQDSIGNTVLHILILQHNKAIACQTMDMLFSYDLKLDHAVPLDMVPNFNGLTPIKMAAKKGNLVAFQHLVNRRRLVQWNMGPLTSNLYDLEEIDSWADALSVLELIVGSQRREARRILEVTPVKQLIFAAPGQNHPRAENSICETSRPLQIYVTYDDNLRLAGEIISIVGALVILLLEIPDMLRVGAKKYFGQTALGGPFHVILISFACLVVLLCVFRLCEVQRETDVMAVCLVLAWSNVLFFARGFQMLGPYVIMIQKIIFGDLTKFMWLSFIMLIGFSTSLWMVYMTQEPGSLPSYYSFPITLFSLFELSVGLIDLPVDHTILTPPVVHVLHCTFSVVSYLLLINVLIAMMSDTQWRVAQERDELWRTQVVATTLMLERRLPRCLWPRLGVCGLLYGLGERWYLRVEDRNDVTLQKMSRYIQAFSKDDDQGKECVQTESADTSKDYINENRKSVVHWQMIRHSVLNGGFIFGRRKTCFHVCLACNCGEPWYVILWGDITNVGIGVPWAVKVCY